MPSPISVACLVSGGIDSMVLLDLTQKSSLKLGYPLTIVHFNFHLRGEESNRDQNFVEKECKKRGLHCFVIDLPIFSGAGIQERVRSARLKKLKELQQKFGWTHILMGHHLNDQAETILMRLSRGSGIRGLQGMSVQSSLTSDCFILRPLLKFSREEIVKYANSQNIIFVEDSTNRQTYYLRNYIRHQVIPSIQKEFPNYLRSIQKAASFLEAENQHFNIRAQKIIDSYNLHSGIAINDYLKWPQEIQFRVIKNLLVIHGFLKQVTSNHYQAIQDLMAKGGEKRFGDCGILISYGKIYFFRFKKEVNPYSLKIQAPGIHEISSLNKKLILEEGDFSSAFNSEKLFLNPEKIRFPLTLRTIEPGERFYPFGGEGSKKISDYLIDKKVPRFLRATQMVLCQGTQIICLLGHQIDHHFRVVNQKENCLKVYMAY